MSVSRAAQQAPTIEHATCLACGCLCDDITLSIQQGRVTAAARACPAGEAWFTADHEQEHLPLASIDSHPATPEAALQQAASLLRPARRLLITGLNSFPISTQRLAVALADTLGATIDPAHSPAAAAHIEALQRKGAVSATLGEVKNRADVVVFWNIDPAQSHPRHFERYSLDAPGRFLKDPRTILAASSQPNATSQRASHHLAVHPRHELLCLRLLRQLVRGQTIDPALSSTTPSVDLAALNHWAASLRNARYGAWFHEPTSDPAHEETLLALIRDLNSHTRFVGLTLGAPGNTAGARAVLTWQTGYPHAVDFSHGYPRYAAAASSAEVLLTRRETDVAFLLGSPGDLSPPALAHLNKIPRILIAPNATASTQHAPTIALTCATPGIHQGGTVMRVDGVTLPVRPPLSSNRPTADHWLQSLLEALQEGVSP